MAINHREQKKRRTSGGVKRRVEEGEDFRYGEYLALIHSLLHGYQRSLSDILKPSGHMVFIRPTIDTFRKIEQASGMDLTRSKNVEAGVENFIQILKRTGQCKDAHFEKIGEGRWEFTVEGCKLAEGTHPYLKGTDIPCSEALILMAIVLEDPEWKKRGIRLHHSTLTETGSRTIIEVQPIKPESSEKK